MIDAVTKLIAECESLGILLTPDGNGGLGIDARKDVLSPDLLERLKASKLDLIAALSANEPLPCSTPALNQPVEDADADNADDEMPASFVWCACGREWMVGPISKRDWCNECSVYRDDDERIPE